ncbi:MAG TPA: transposase, partial [Ktedonobacteraceae bacterium]
MAIESTVEAVPDTPANAKVFGRFSTGKGACAFPQVRGVYLQECGTHAIVDAGFWPCHPNEQLGAHRLLTTLLDPVQAPAHDLVQLYHERWEIEIGIDEIDTHQRLLSRTLRSKTPMGVMQELFGCLLV